MVSFLASSSFLATLNALWSSMAIVAFREKPLIAFYRRMSGLLVFLSSSSLLSAAECPDEGERGDKSSEVALNLA